jgi:hypothetical protein
MRVFNLMVLVSGEREAHRTRRMSAARHDVHPMDILNGSPRGSGSQDRAGYEE